MCIVYQAWDTRLERNVAVKRLDPALSQDPRTRARFDREGRALAQLSHPNLVTLIDRGSTENEEYLIFEYVEGRSLKDVIREGELSIAEVGSIVGQVAEGLAAAHQAGIVHRDVKPQNILIDRQGHAKVSDFGIATGPDWTRVTRAGSIIGSARYMSPEQVRSKPVDARSDIYSLGVVMYELLAGHPPFDGTNMPEIARQHLNSPPPPLSDVRQRPSSRAGKGGHALPREAARGPVRLHGRASRGPGRTRPARAAAHSGGRRVPPPWAETRRRCPQGSGLARRHLIRLRLPARRRRPVVGPDRPGTRADPRRGPQAPDQSKIEDRRRIGGTDRGRGSLGRPHIGADREGLAFAGGAHPRPGPDRGTRRRATK